MNVTTEAAAQSGQQIERLEVTGGFLDGAVLDFTGGLNCLIGSRGSGKTTALELVRHALNLFPRDEYVAGARKKFDSLVADNLKDGRVRITVKTRDGVSYIIDRTATGEAMILTEEELPTAIKLNNGSFFTADIYSQNQIEGIADKPENQLALLDRFAAEGIREVGQDIRTTVGGLEANANEILTASKELESLSGDLDHLGGIEERLKAFAGVTNEKSEEINRAHALHSLRDREKRAVESTLEVLRTNHNDLKRCLNAIEGGISGVLSQELQDGPNGSWIKTILKIIQECERGVTESIEKALGQIVNAGQAISKERDALHAEHQKQELVFRELIEKQKEAQGKEAERIRLETQRNALAEKKRKSEELRLRIQRLQGQREEQLRLLSSHYDRRFAIRKGVADEINAVLGRKIRVSVDQYGDQDNYVQFLTEMLSPRFKGITLRRLAEGLPPRQLREAIMFATTTDPECSLLIDQGGISKEQADKLITVMANQEVLFRLDTIEIGDKPSIELLDGEEFKASATLSTGQKCTTILPILLLKGENPLLVDQPEDNLDNRFIYESVVEIIRKVRNRRQLIFVTHNPNIPVLGDASRVFVLRSDGKRAEVERSGTVEECRNDIITLLEGGDEAFRQRQKKYGIA